MPNRDLTLSGGGGDGAAVDAARAAAAAERDIAVRHGVLLLTGEA